MASFQISPGVLVQEQDFSLIIPSIPVNIGAIVGDFNWGPVNEITLISDEPTLVATFGAPVDRNGKDWFCARNFLTYSQNLNVVRVADPTSAAANANDLIGLTPAGALLNAGATSEFKPGTTVVGLFIQNYTDFQNQRQLLAGVNLLSTTTLKWIARFPGTTGNQVSVSYADSVGFATWAYAPYFTYAPRNNVSGSLAPLLDELAVVVLLNGVVVEQYLVSQHPGTLDGNGQVSYMDNVINAESNYVYVLTENLLTTTVDTTAGANTGLARANRLNSGTNPILLGGGGDQTAPSISGATSTLDSVSMTGWGLFAAAEYIDINYCMQGGQSTNIGQFIVQNVAEIRKDCVGFLSPEQGCVVANATPSTSVSNYRTGAATPYTSDNLNIDSSYGFMDGNYKYQYDKYNAKYRWVPFNGDCAGLLAQTALTNDPWWSPAGLNRGQIKDVVKLAFNPTKAQRDDLYKVGINPIVSFPGEGTVLFGDKTLQSRPSAFDRINVRMLFIVIEKAIAKASRYLLFEFNDTFTQNRFIQMVEPYLRDVQARRGIDKWQGQDGFYVIADGRVNTAEVVDSNEFRATILIKPARSINFITLTFAATRTGVEFQELANEITGLAPTGVVNLNA